MSDEPEGKWIEFTLPDLGKLSFPTAAHFGDWLQDEEKFISDHLNNVGNVSGVGDHHRKQMLERMKVVKEAFEHAKNDSSMLGALRRELEEGFTRDIPPSQSRFGLFVQNAKKRYNKDVANEAASYMLLKFQGHQRPGAYMSGLGAFLAQLWEEHVPTRADLELGSDMYAKWSSELDGAKWSLEMWKTESEQALKDTRESLKLLQEKYAQVRSLEEPAQFWHDKWWRHRAVVFMVAILTLGAAFGFGAWLVSAADTARERILEIQDPNPWQVASNAFPVLIGAIGLFWLLRILARILFQQLHLASDANERKVLIKTYLSLLVGSGVLKGTPGLQPEHLGIILAQVFRAGHQGIVAEDAAPPLPASYLTSHKD